MIIDLVCTDTGGCVGGCVIVGVMWCVGVCTIVGAWCCVGGCMTGCVVCCVNITLFEVVQGW